jgi:hypothetical protein
VWIVIGLLTVPMFRMSAKELAPTEDQGVIFGIVDAAANATLDQTSRYAAAVNEAFLSVPETDFTFQITQLSLLGLRRHGGQALGGARADHLRDPARGAAESCTAFPASRSSRSRRRPCPAAASFRWNSSSPPPPSRIRSWSSPSRFSSRPPRAGCSPFRR